MSNVDLGRTFRFAGAEVAPGTKLQTELPIARMLVGTQASMPVLVIHGRRPGPTLWVSGAIHGDELNGTAIVRTLVQDLEPALLAGTVLAVPIVNVFGVTIGSRYLPDRRDLNRSFPGSAKGSLAARLAHLFFENVARRCDVGIDFHTGSNGRSNLPQVRCDLDDDRTRVLAEAFAAPITLHASVRDGSLRSSARKHGIRVLLFEAGEANRLDAVSIGAGVRGAKRVMYAMGMLRKRPRREAHRLVVSRRSTWVRARRSGLCFVHVELGERVRAGQAVATIADNMGLREAAVRARSEGLVIGLFREALVHRGDAIVHLAEVND